MSDDLTIHLDTPAARANALRAALVGAVESVTRAAEIFAAMEAAGDDTSAIPPHIVRMLYRIQTKNMLPEVFVELGGRLRSRVALLPIPRQRAILDGQLVPLVIVGNGTVDVLQVDARKLEPAQVIQIFGDGYIRDESQQRIWIETREKKALPSTDEEDATKIIVDKIKGGIRVRGKFVSKKRMLRLLAELESE